MAQRTSTERPTDEWFSQSLEVRLSRFLLLDRPHFDPHLARFVVQIGVDAVARTGDYSPGHHFKHLIVEAKRRYLLEPFLVGPERDVSDVARLCPERGDMLVPGRIAAAEQDDGGIFGESFVERSPDAVVVLIGRAGHELDPGTDGHHRSGLRAALGGNEVAAVDHGGGHGGVAATDSTNPKLRPLCCHVRKGRFWTWNLDGRHQCAPRRTSAFKNSNP